MLFAINQTKLYSHRQFFFLYYSKEKKGYEREGISQLPDKAKRCKSTWSKRWENSYLNTKTRRDTGDTERRHAEQAKNRDPTPRYRFPSLCGHFAFRENSDRVFVCQRRDARFDRY